MTLSHNEGGTINPCIKVLHQIIDGVMFEQVELMGNDDVVHLTVPDGFRLVSSGDGYDLLPVVVDR